MEQFEQQERTILEGFISVEAALEASSREIFEIVIRSGKSNSSISRLERAAGSRGVRVRRATNEEINSLAAGTSHGGVIALTGPRRFVDLETMGRQPRDEERTVPWYVMVDGVEDPYNFGAAVRSVYSAGAAGLILRPRNWFTASGLVARASAGASERIPTAIAETVEDAANLFRDRGFTIACAGETPASVSLYDADLTGPLFILIGGEKRGITRSFQNKADLTLRIPYGTRKAYSLGTAAASAVIAFEILRQRMEKSASQKSST